MTSPFEVIAQMWLALFLESLQHGCNKLRLKRYHLVVAVIFCFHLLVGYEGIFEYLLGGE